MVLFFFALVALANIIACTLAQPPACENADIPWEDAPSSPLTLNADNAANLTTRTENIRNFIVLSRVNVESSTASDISINFDIKFSDPDLSSTVSYKKTSNDVILVIDGTSYYDNHPYRPAECLVAETTVSVPSSLAHLIIDTDNTGIIFHDVSSIFSQLDIRSINGLIGFKDDSKLTIKDLKASVGNGPIFTDKSSVLKTTESAILSSRNGHIHGQVSGPYIDASSNNGAIRLTVIDDASSTSEAGKHSISATSENGAVRLILLSPSAPYAITASSHRGAVSTSLLSPTTSGTFTVDAEVGSARAEGDVQITRKTKHGFLGGLVEGTFGFDGEDGKSSIDIWTSLGSARFFVGSSDDDETPEDENSIDLEDAASNQDNALTSGERKPDCHSSSTSDIYPLFSPKLSLSYLHPATTITLFILMVLMVAIVVVRGNVNLIRQRWDAEEAAAGAAGQGIGGGNYVGAFDKKMKN